MSMRICVFICIQIVDGGYRWDLHILHPSIILHTALAVRPLLLFALVGAHRIFDIITFSFCFLFAVVFTRTVLLDFGPHFK